MTIDRIDAIAEYISLTCLGIGVPVAIVILLLGLTGVITIN